MSKPDFYLASTEGYGLEEPHSCWRIKRVTVVGRDDFVLARVDPPVPVGLEHCDVDRILLATRHVGFSLFPISKWPPSVYVARTYCDNPESKDNFLRGEFRVFAWAELYRTEEDARTKAL